MAVSGDMDERKNVAVRGVVCQHRGGVKTSHHVGLWKLGEDNLNH